MSKEVPIVIEGDLSSSVGGIIAARLNWYLRRADMTGAQLSRRSGVSMAVISRIRSAAQPDYALSSLVAICVALDISIDWLCGRKNLSETLKHSQDQFAKKAGKEPLAL